MMEFLRIQMEGIYGGYLEDHPSQEVIFTPIYKPYRLFGRGITPVQLGDLLSIVAH